MGKSSINGLFSMAMLNNQRVYDIVLLPWNISLNPMASPGQIGEAIGDETTHNFITNKRGWNRY